MLGCLRYCVSHCLRAAMTRLEEVNGEVSSRSSVRWLGYLSGFNLLVALCLGLYARWERTLDTSLLVIFILALIVPLIASIVYYYFNMERVSLSILHLWFGFLLGLQCFFHTPAAANLDRDVKEQAANYLLLASVSLRTLWALLERLFGCTKYKPAFLTSAERLELLGFTAASTSLLFHKSLSVMVLVVALATLMVALRMKAVLALPNLICFSIITSVLFFQALDITTNPFALACFFSQLICDPLLDVYFSGLSVIERWQPFLVWRALWRRMSLLPLLLVEVTFIILAARKLNALDHQWYLMIPGFVVCVIFWLICHLVFVITVWGFHTKLSECQRLCLSQGSGVSGLDKVMASKGMRHFCLISERLVLFSLVSTVAVAALCWQNKRRTRQQRVGFSVLLDQHFFWAICHMVFVITVWGFHTKLSECQRLCLSQGSGVSGLDKVMASKGMRHFCLISERLVLFSLVSTVAVAALCWQASSSIFVSMFLLVLPLESLFHGLFHELGNSLGGTCVGYAVVIPTNYCSPDGQPTLLPPGQVQELNRRSTGILNNVQRFFAHHLIETFGCDYSLSGMTQEALQAKIKRFLELRTADGPRHDTYVIFYSGHSYHSGEWALAGGDTLRLDTILEWWREKNSSFCSRLILVLDCDHSSAWVREVQKVEGPYVAVQGATLLRVTDVELQDPPQLGDFTAQWVEYNCNSNSNIQWSQPGRAVSAAYGISKYWSDYTLHLPTGNDVANLWSMYFPRMTYPVVQLALWSGVSNELGLCSICLRFLRRVKLNWFPPAILDTGQGFKLVRS